MEWLLSGKQMAETVLRLFLTEVKAFLACDLNRERLPCFSAGTCIVVGCGFGVGFGLDCTSASVLVHT
jgi:hypothetical protein